MLRQSYAQRQSIAAWDLRDRLKAQAEERKKREMANPIQISIVVSRKLTDGNWGSKDHHAGVTVELEPGDDILAVEKEWREWCKERIREAFAKKGNTQANPSEHAQGA